MANHDHTTDHVNSRSKVAGKTLTIPELRNLAQDHLRSIEADVSSEAEAQIQSQAVLQKYTKVKRKDRPRSKSPTQAAAATSISTVTAGSRTSEGTVSAKGPRLRSAGDVLDRLKWDPSVKLDDYSIGYLERFDGILEMPAANWIKESTDEDFIPQHRIKWVKKRSGGSEVVVWDRELRIDKLFGSGNHVPGTMESTDLESVDDSVGGGVPVQQHSP